MNPHHEGLPERPKASAALKEVGLRERGMQPIGRILIDPATGRRASVDYYGRVQWWDVLGNGEMVAMGQG